MKLNKKLIFNIPSKVSEIKNIRDQIKDLCIENKVNEFDVFNIQLALDEACSNAIEHGCMNKPEMDVQVIFKLRTDEMVLAVSDTGGIEFNPEFFERIATRKTWGTGGRGIFLLKSICDEVTFIFIPNKKTILFLKKKIQYQK